MNDLLMQRAARGWGLVTAVHTWQRGLAWLRVGLEARNPDIAALCADFEDGRELRQDLAELLRLDAMVFDGFLIDSRIGPYATDAAKDAAFPQGWVAPVAGAVANMIRKIGDKRIEDEQLLAILEETVAELPGLLDAMDVEGLAESMERGMEEAVVEGVEGGPQTADRRPKTEDGRPDFAEATSGRPKTADLRPSAFAMPTADMLSSDLSGSVGPIQAAVEKMGRKSPVGARLSSAEWARVPVAIRERAQFSAHVESARFLSTVQSKLQKRLKLEKETVDRGTAFVDRDSFIRDMRGIAREEGLETGEGGLRDPASVGRLGLIYDQQTRSAAEYARWKMGQDADVLDEFPAWRFVRVIDVQTPRDFHAQFEGAVRLKTDLAFWTGVNADFGVPWGPWGWNCGHDVEDVDRAECEALGLLAPDERVEPVEKDFNERLEASVADMKPGVVEWLQEALGEKVEITDGHMVFRGEG